MTRLEEHEIVMNEMYKLIKSAPTNTNEEKAALSLAVCSTYLMDISKSLAVIADKAEREEEDDKR